MTSNQFASLLKPTTTSLLLEHGDSGKLLCDQRSAAYKGSVDVGTPHELVHALGGDRAAVLDADLVGYVLSVGGSKVV